MKDGFATESEGLHHLSRGLLSATSRHCHPAPQTAD